MERRLCGALSAVLLSGSLLFVTSCAAEPGGQGPTGTQAPAPEATEVSGRLHIDVALEHAPGAVVEMERSPASGRSPSSARTAPAPSCTST